MEVVEVSPRYESERYDGVVGVRAIMDVLATMVKHDRVGGKLV